MENSSVPTIVGVYVALYVPSPLSTTVTVESAFGPAATDTATVAPPDVRSLLPASRACIAIDVATPASPPGTTAVVSVGSASPRSRVIELDDTGNKPVAPNRSV